MALNNFNRMPLHIKGLIYRGRLSSIAYTPAYQCDFRFDLFFSFSFSFSFPVIFRFSFALVLQYFFVLVLLLPTTK